MVGSNLPKINIDNSLPGKSTDIPVRLLEMVVADVQPVVAVRVHVERVVGTSIFILLLSTNTSSEKYTPLVFKFASNCFFSNILINKRTKCIIYIIIYVLFILNP